MADKNKSGSATGGIIVIIILVLLVWGGCKMCGGTQSKGAQPTVYIGKFNVQDFYMKSIEEVEKKYGQPYYQDTLTSFQKLEDGMQTLKFKNDDSVFIKVKVNPASNAILYVQFTKKSDHKYNDEEYKNLLEEVGITQDVIENLLPADKLIKVSNATSNDDWKDVYEVGYKLVADCKITQENYLL